MGDRIVIDITDGDSFTPSFYGHWCGLRAVKTLNDTFRNASGNGINSLYCNFIVNIMEGRTQQYSFYSYNHGEAEGSADWDNYTWCFNVKTQMWKTDFPGLEGKTLTMDEADAFVKERRPCLYRTCKCADYGGVNCTLKLRESHGL